MSDFRVGDRVRAEGVVDQVDNYGWVYVIWDGASGQFGFAARHQAALTLIERPAPPEPPVGSVVVKDGTAWVREHRVQTGARLSWRGLSSMYRDWSDISDGDVIFTPGGDA
jgi:hypothetical protein